ncbi:MAG: AAA family ATPase, partial [Gammaproteobacteria bacterium]
IDRDAFKALIQHSFTQAGATVQLLSDSAIELIRMASQGNPRRAHQVITASLRLAGDRQMNHLPDDIIQEAINMFK